ncbi:MAG: response regulator [Nitrososphaeraceae archaeon]|jgi:DNA-binding response OmpR family regulator
MTLMKKILLVDDDPDANLSLSILLRDRGFDVDSFTSPSDALKYFRRNYYDLLVLDVRMPNMDGFELYRAIREVDTKAKIWFFAAAELDNYRVAELEDMMEELGEECFISKPIENNEILCRINTILTKTNHPSPT